jgi:hypothetical protein
MTRRLEKLFVATGLTVVVALVFAAVMQELARRKGPEPLVALKISASRSADGLEITSHEDTPIGECEAIVFDKGDATWTAAAAGRFVQSETFRVSWSEFKSNNQTMPPQVGLNRPLFSISCLVDERRRSAGVTFE